MAIINKIKALNQRDFANIIRVDTHYDEQLPIGGGFRSAEFHCPMCNNDYVGRVAVEKERKEPGCTKCYIKKRYPDFFRTRQLLEAFKKLDYAIGVWNDIRFDTYKARISHNGERVFIGTYDTREEAMLAYDDYIIEHELDKFTNEQFTKT